MASRRSAVAVSTHHKIGTPAKSPDVEAPFDIDVVMARVRKAIQPFPKAPMFELFEQGYTSLFDQIVACMISMRTRDEMSGPVARELFRRARIPARMLQLTTDEIAGLIKPSMFREGKAKKIRVIAQRAAEEFGADLPCDYDTLVSVPGAGPKSANLALGIACHQSRISVDIHVHRVANRWGYVSTRTPEDTTAVLAEKLPDKYRIEINSLLVPFGKHICTGQLPHCSTCPVLDMCRQVGVTAHR